MKKVVLIENEISILTMMEHLLGSIPDITVKTYSNASRGLEMVFIQKPDVVVTDFQMPEMNGDEVIRLIRENPETAETYIILLTSILPDDERLMDIGADKILTKPNDFRLLMEFLKTI